MGKVICHNCKEEVYETTRDINSGDLILSEDFQGINGYPDPSDGNEIACPNCSSKSGIYAGLESATGHEILA